MTKIKFRRKLRKLRHKLKAASSSQEQSQVASASQAVPSSVAAPTVNVSRTYPGNVQTFLNNIAGTGTTSCTATRTICIFDDRTKSPLKADGVGVIYRLQLIICSGSSGQAREHILSYQHRNFIMAPTIRSMINFNVTQAMQNL